MKNARLPLDQFHRFVTLNADPQLRESGNPRIAARGRVLTETAEALQHGTTHLLRELPRIIGTHMQPFGWMWNGFYALDAEGDLRLSTAFGPPVCSTLERSGGVLTSGMCFDSLHANQTLAAHDVKSWPGYVSCDATSRLGTVSGIVAPVRDGDGQPIAVWDMDATLEIEDGDTRFFDVLFATLARCMKFTPADFESAARPASA